MLHGFTSRESIRKDITKVDVPREARTLLQSSTGFADFYPSGRAVLVWMSLGSRNLCANSRVAEGRQISV